MRGTTTATLPLLIALNLPMEVALARKAWRSAEQVRFMSLEAKSHPTFPLTHDKKIYTTSDYTNNIVGWCDYICCNAEKEETCYVWDDDSDSTTAYCAAFAEGGCPCPEGMKKCGAGKVLLSTCK
jgi:hypothetical protein